ncbi:MAG: hypothetical protein QOF76_313 [Solirubrobacteraceae bacterium]|nr:hypothetical protein [Solirubrobacteraceae bacterium]
MCVPPLVGKYPNCHVPIVPSRRVVKARISGINACQDSTFTVNVTIRRSSQVKRVVFILNGQKLKSLRRPNVKSAAGVYQIRINPAARPLTKGYRLVTRVRLKKTGTFVRGASIRTRTLRPLTFDASNDCDPPPHSGRR